MLTLAQAMGRSCFTPRWRSQPRAWEDFWSEAGFGIVEPSALFRFRRSRSLYLVTSSKHSGQPGSSKDCSKLPNMYSLSISGHFGILFFFLDNLDLLYDALLRRISLRSRPSTSSRISILPWNPSLSAQSCCLSDYQANVS